MASIQYDQNALRQLGDIRSTVTAGSGREIVVRGFAYVLSGVSGTYAGTTSYTVAASATSHVYLDGTGSLTHSTTGYPDTPHVKLARVTATTTSVISILADRAEISEVGPSGINLSAGSGAPITPPAGRMSIAGIKQAGATHVTTVTPSGKRTGVTPRWPNFRTALYATSNSTGTTTFMGFTLTATGTVSHFATMGSASRLTTTRKLSINSPSTLDSSAELHILSRQMVRGTYGGFLWVARVSFTQLTTLCAGFFGIANQATSFGAPFIPSSLTNMMGFGWDSTEANLSFMHNDGSGTATKIALGASFPVADNVDWYTMTIFAPPGSSSVHYKIELMSTGVSTSGTVTTDLPSETLGLTWHLHMNNNEAAFVQFDCTHVYMGSMY